MIRAVALIVAAVVIVAGCSAAPSTETPTTADRTDTEAPTETETETTVGAMPTPTSTAETATPTATPTDTATPTARHPPETPAATFVVDDDTRVAVTLEVADTPSERRRGLMGRPSLERNHGMLFVYGSERQLSFWMKDTLIPLDIIFIDANHTVLNVEHADVQLNTTPSELPRYRSDGPAKYAIEVNRGFANRTGVGPGTTVEFHGNETLLTPEG